MRLRVHSESSSGTLILMQLPLKLADFTHWRALIVAIVVLVLGGYYFFGQGADLGATLTIAQKNFEQQVSVSGTVIATKDADLGFSSNGRVAYVYARVGQHVSAGTTLAEIENGDLVATLAQAKADLASLLSGTRQEEIDVATVTVKNAEASLINAIQNAYTSADDAVRNRTDSFFSNPRTEPKLSFNISNANLKTVVENDRLSAEKALNAWAVLISELAPANVADSAKQSQVYLAQVTTLLADANAALNQGLPDTTTSSATLSTYATTLATGRTNVNNSGTDLTTASATLDSSVKNLTLKQAGATKDSVASQQATVASAQSAIAKTIITAPFSGVVTRVDAKVGEIVSPSTSLISMQSDGIFQIETYVPEVSIAQIQVGNKATTTLDAYGPSVKLSAVVVAVDPAETVRDGVPAYKTTLSFLEKNSSIRSGMTANILITTGSLQNTIVIPRGAVGIKNGSSYVSVVINGQPVDRTVTTGASPALGQVEILSGLSTGDVVLLSPTP